MNDPIRPGVWTSEFWVTVGSALAGLVTAAAPLFGLRPEGAEPIANAIRDSALHIGGLAVIVAAAWKYVAVRGQVKAAAVTPPEPTPQIILNEPGA